MRTNSLDFSELRSLGEAYTRCKCDGCERQRLGLGGYQPCAKGGTTQNNSNTKSPPKKQ